MLWVEVVCSSGLFSSWMCVVCIGFMFPLSSWFCAGRLGFELPLFGRITEPSERVGYQPDQGTVPRCQLG